jgi:hypothetical protein
MENKYSKQLIERTKELYSKHSPSELSDSDAIECIDNMSSLINYLAVLNEKYFPEPMKKTEAEEGHLTKTLNYIKLSPEREQEKE